jgi:hypothetical protein
MYSSIDQWISMNRIDGRGDFGGPIQKGIVSYSVSSNAQVIPALTEMPNDFGIRIQCFLEIELTGVSVH